MLVNSLGKNKIKITLTAFEITKLFGSYENIDYANSDTKTVLNLLLEKAVEMSNAEFESGALFVEVYPTALGGCNIYFTRIKSDDKRPGRRLKKVTQNTLSCVLEFEKSDDLLRAVDYLYKKDNPEIQSSSLYKHNNTYRLLIVGTKPVKEKVGLIKEFAKNIYYGTEIAANLIEHAKQIVPDKAIENIGRSFSRDL